MAFDFSKYANKPKGSSKSSTRGNTPSTISSEIAPDIGRMTQHDRVQFPQTLRILPVVFYLSLVFMVFMAWNSTMSAARYNAGRSNALSQAAQVSMNIEQVIKSTAEVKSKVDMATNLAAWTETGIMFQPMLVAIASACDGKVQINDMAFVRDDPKGARYSFTLSCVGDARNFSGLERGIDEIFKSNGWSTVTVLNTSEGSKFSLHLYLLRPTETSK